MFKDLFKLSSPRSFVQAIGFYIVYTIILLLLAFICGAIYGVSVSDVESDTAAMIGTIIAGIFSLVLSLILLVSKKRIKNTGYILLAVVAGGLSYLLGGFVGMILVAFLSTIKPAGYTVSTQPVPPIAQPPTTPVNK